MILTTSIFLRRTQCTWTYKNVNSLSEWVYEWAKSWIFYSKYGTLPVTQFTKNQSLFLKSLAECNPILLLVRARTIPIVVLSLSILLVLFPMNKVWFLLFHMFISWKKVQVPSVASQLHQSNYHVFTVWRMSERVLSPSGINFYLQAQQQNNKTGSNSDLTAEQIAGNSLLWLPMLL